MADLGGPQADSDGAMARWRRAIGMLFDIGATPQEIGEFSGDIIAHATGQLVLSEGHCSRVTLVRSADTITRSPLDHFAIRLLSRGSMAGLAGAREIVVEAEDVCFLDLSQSANLQTSLHRETTEDITLWVPRRRFMASFTSESTIHGHVIKARTPAGELIGASIRSLAKQAPRLTAAELDEFAGGVIELIARSVTAAKPDGTAAGAACVFCHHPPLH